MKKLVSFVSLALVAAGVSTGCAVDSLDAGVEDVATGEEALCANNQDHAINAFFATLSAAMAKELHQVEFVSNFEVFVDYSPYYQEKIRLNQLTQQWVCNVEPHGCQTIKALLAFQNDANSNKYVFQYGSQQVSFSADVLRNRLIAGYRAQKVCEDRPASDRNTCKAEFHYLEEPEGRAGACSLDIIKYKVTQPTWTGAAPNTPLSRPDLLARKFIWAEPDQALPLSNPYLQFAQVDATHVEWDPSIGGVGLSTSGACGTSLLTFSPGANIAGSCCVVNGVTKSYQPYTAVSVAGYYKCQ